MAAFDRHDINKAILTAFRADATLEALIGADSAMRLFDRVPKSVAVFPWVRMDFIGSPPITGTKKGPGIEWARTHTVQFTVFDNKTTLNGVAAVQKAIADIMDAAPDKLSLTGDPTVFQSIPRNEFCTYEVEAGTAVAILEYELWISSV